METTVYDITLCKIVVKDVIGGENVSNFLAGSCPASNCHKSILIKEKQA